MTKFLKRDQVVAITPPYIQTTRKKMGFRDGRVGPRTRLELKAQPRPVSGA